MIFWLGLGNPCHIATKSQHLWAVPRQIKFWSILKKKLGLGKTPAPLLGPNSQLLPKKFFPLGARSPSLLQSPNICDRMKNVPKSVLEALSIGLALNVMLFDVGLDWILCTEQQWNVSQGHCQCPFSPVQFNRAAALGALSCIAPCLCPNYKIYVSLIAFKTCSSLGVHFRRLALSCFAAIGCTATSCLTPTMCPFKWARRFYSRENTLSLWAWHWHTPRCISANKCCPAKLCFLKFGWNVSNSICSAKYCWLNEVCLRHQKCWHHYWWNNCKTYQKIWAVGKKWMLLAKHGTFRQNWLFLVKLIISTKVNFFLANLDWEIHGKYVPFVVSSLFHSQTLFYSSKDASNLQHRDEVQDEGAHDGRRCDLLEVDIGEYDRPGDRNHGVSLEHGGGLPASQDIWQAFLPCWMSGIFGCYLGNEY